MLILVFSTEVSADPFPDLGIRKACLAGRLLPTTPPCRQMAQLLSQAVVVLFSFESLLASFHFLSIQSPLRRRAVLDTRWNQHRYREEEAARPSAAQGSCCWTDRRTSTTSFELAFGPPYRSNISSSSAPSSSASNTRGAAFFCAFTLIYLASSYDSLRAEDAVTGTPVPA
jgi:hypothetical protein